MKGKGLCAARGVVYNITAGRYARSNTGKEIIGSYAKMYRNVIAVSKQHSIHTYI